MDAKDIKSDLVALQRLYSLLRNDEDGMPNPASNMLDKRGRVLLKHLLDTATHSTLKKHYKIISGQVEELLIPSSPFNAQQLDDSFKEQPFLLPNMLMTREVDQNYGKNSRSDQERNFDGRKFTGQGSPATFEEKSTSNVSIGPEFRKKRCRVCKRSTVKQIDTNEERNFYDPSKNSDGFTHPRRELNNQFDRFLWSSELEIGSALSDKTDCSRSEMGMKTTPFLCKMSDVGSAGFSSDAVVLDTKMCSSNLEARYKPEETDCILKEASEAIEHLESCISALKLGEDRLQRSQKSSAQHQNLVMNGNESPCKISKSAQNPVEYLPRNQEGNVSAEVIKQASMPIQPTNSTLCQSRSHLFRDGEVMGNNHVSGAIEESIEEHNFSIQNHNLKALIDKMESENWRKQIQNVWNINVAADQKERYPLPEIKVDNALQKHMAMKGQSRHGVSRPSEASNSFVHLNDVEELQSIDSNHNATSDWGTRSNKHPPYVVKETPRTSEHQSGLRHNNRIAMSRYSVTAPRESLHQKDLGDTPCTSYSSNRRSRQSSSFDSDNEDYSFSHHSRSGDISSSASIESGASLMSHRTWSEYGSYRSNSNSEFYSSTSHDVAHEVTSSSNNKSDGYSSYDQTIHHHVEPTFSWKKSISRKDARDRFRKSADDIKGKKQRGTWKRLKDRLAIIFHHHHHHHHHHGTDYHGNHSDYDFLKKHMRKTVHSNNEEEAYGQMAVEKMRKSLIHNKRQKGNFHGLVEGFLRHIRHSKKSKPTKETIGKLSKNQHARKKKALAKSQWWKLLQHQRGGAKFPNKAHTKVLGKNNSHKKALPKSK